MAANKYSETQEIIDIQVKYKDAVVGIANIKKEIEKLEEKNKKLKYAFDTAFGDEARQQVAANELAIRQYKEEMRALQKETQNEIRQQEQKTGSLKAMRAELSNLVKRYDELSAAQREADSQDETNGLAAQIRKLSQDIKDAEASTNRFYRNVGNYEGATKSLKQELKELVAQLAEMKLNGQDNGEEYEKLTKRAGELKDAMGDATAQVQRMASDTADLDTVLSAMTTGGGVFEVVTGSLELMGIATDGVEEAQRKLQATMAVVQGLTAVQNNLQKESALMLGVSALQTWALQKAEAAELATKTSGTAATVAATVAQRAFNLVAKANPYVLLATALVSVVGALALFSKGSKEAERKQRELNAEMANTNSQIERIKNESDFNIEIAKAAGASEKAIRKMRLEAARAAEALAWLNLQRASDEGTKEQADAAREEWEKANKTINDIISEGVIADIKARTEARKKRTEAIKQDGESAAEARKQAAEREREAIRAAEDATIQIIVNNVARQRAQINAQYQRTIEDLQRQLSDKGLTEKTRKAIQSQISSQKELWKKALADLNAEVIRSQIENEQQRIQYLLQAVGDDYLKRRELQLAQLANEQKLEEEKITQEIQDEQMREDTLMAMRIAYNAKRLAVEQEFDKAIQDEKAKRIQQEFQTQIDAAGDNELETLRLQMEERLALLNAMQQREGESIEAFNQRKLEAERSYQQAKKTYAEKEVALENAKVKAIGSAVGALSDLMEEAGEKNKSMAMAAKVLALAEIAINQGVAIAEGIKQAQSVPYPANIAAIASTIATILTGVTQAIKTVKSAKFATGGYVEGAGTGTSDSIPARLSNGESVMTAGATTLFSPLLSALNQLGGGIPIIATNPQQQMGEDMLAAAVAKGMAMAPRPVVSVQDIYDGQRRVEVIDNIASV